MVTFEVPRLISADMFVLYDGSQIYAPLSELFTLLEINLDIDAANQVYSGFFLDRDQTYRLDFKRQELRIGDRRPEYDSRQFVIGEHEMYIRLDAFGELFELELTFDFSRLRIILPLNQDFPAYQRIKRQIQRRRLLQEEQEDKSIVELPRDRQMAAGAVVDWNLSTTPIASERSYYYSLDAGGMLLNGDAFVGISGSKQEPFDTDQIRYRWKYLFDNSRIIKQVNLGQVSAGGSLSRSLEGVLLTNQSPVRRRYYQTISIADTLGPGWEVELYDGGKLIGFATTDAAGAYEFTTDVLYGESNLSLKLYGPSGETRTEERLYRAPYSLVPQGIFEYSLAAGQSDSYNNNTMYAQTTANYGVLRDLTLGVSSDIPLGATDAKKPLVAAEAAYRLFNSLVFNTEFTPTYRATGRTVFSQPKLINVNAAFSVYFENPERNPFHQKYNANIALSAPLRIGSLYTGLRYYVSVDQFETRRLINMNYGASVSINPIHANYLGKLQRSEFDGGSTSDLTSQLILLSRYPQFVHPQLRVDYSHSRSQIERYGLYLVKQVFRTGQLAVSVEHSPVTRSNSIVATLNLFTDFASFTTRSMTTQGQTTVNQRQQGSLRFDNNTGRFTVDRRSSIGRGTAVVMPFHDVNYNGVRDPEEEELAGLRAKISGGRPRFDREHRQYYYEGLVGYETYRVDVDEFSLDNPLLKPAQKSFRVTINPHVVTPIDVPVVTAAEISGRVDRALELGQAGIGGIRIRLYSLSSDAIIDITTFSSGEFYYLGLLPGSYRAEVDPEQLVRYGYTAEPAAIEFVVEPIEGGAVIEDLSFVLKPTAAAQ